MIDLWQLPGPLRLAHRIFEYLDGGNQVSFKSDQVWERGLRLAVERELNRQQTALTLIHDEPATPVSALVKAGRSEARPPEGVYWITGIVAERAAKWQHEARCIAEDQRDRLPGERLQIVTALPVAPDNVAGIGYKALIEPIALLSRLDLEIMARYRLTRRAEAPVLLGIIAEIATTLTFPMLGRLGCDVALDMLDAWLDMPLDCAGDPISLRAYARQRGLPDGEPTTFHLVIWRAQQAVLMAEIDSRRMAVVESAGNWCRVPYVHESARTQRPETVAERWLLEVAHLTKMVHDAQVPRRDPVKDSLVRLKTARDGLAHLKPLPVQQIKQLLKLDAYTFNLDLLARKCLP